MKILAVVPLYPPHHLGGYEVVCRGVMERLHERGHEVVVLTGEKHLAGADEASTPNSVDVRRALKGWWDWKAHRALRPTIPERFRIERHNQRAVADVLEEFRPDVASIWSMVYMSWTVATQIEARSIPIVLTFGDHWITFGHQFDAWTRVFDRRPALRPFGRLIGLETRLPAFGDASATVASRMIYDTIEQAGRWKFPSAPVVPMGVENRLFPIADAPPARPWAWRILYVGRVERIKGLTTLVRALAALPAEATLEIDGRGGEEFLAELADLARSLGVAERVRFTCSSRPELVRRYREADVVVFPSEWPEPFGIVALEAMACGVPVVATGTGGSGEFLADGENCVLFTPGDSDALAAAVRRVAVDDALRHRMVAGGTQTVRRMNMDRYAETLEELHARAVSAQRA